MKKQWYKTKWFFIFAVLSTVVAAYAADEIIRADKLKFGTGASGQNKVLEFETGDGVANKKLTVDDTTKNASFNVNELTLGDGADSDKKMIQDLGLGAANPFFKYDTALDKWTFSNDGSLEKAIGSGSGGGAGVNLLSELNADFEAGSPPSEWLNVGTATFVSEIVIQGFDLQSGKWDANLTGATLSSPLVPVPLGLQGSKCAALINYTFAGGVLGDVKFRILQAGAVVVAEKNLDPSTVWREDILMVDCGTDIQLQLLSTADASPVLLDNIHLGSLVTAKIENNGLISGILKANADVGCLPIVSARNNDLFTSFDVGASCDNWSAIGNANTISTGGIPKFTTNLEKGSYVAEVQIEFGSNTTSDINTTCGFGVEIDGEIHGMSVQTLDDAGNQINPASTLTTTFDVGVAGAKVVEVKAIQNGGSINNCTLRLDNNKLPNHSVKVYRTSGPSKEAITLSTVGAYLSVSHDETCSFPSSATSYADFSSDSTCSLSLDNVSGFSNVTSTDSGGDLTPGITFTMPFAGSFYVCAAYEVDASVSENIGVRLMNGPTVLDERGNTLTAAGDRRGQRLCGISSVSSSGPVTYRLQGKIGSTSLNIGNRTTSDDVAIKWIVIPIGQSFPTPIFQDLQDSLQGKVSHNFATQISTCSFRIANAGSPSIADHDNCLLSVTDNGVGNTIVNFNVGLFNLAPTCVIAASNGSFDRECHIAGGGGSTSINTRCNAGGAADLDFNGICFGK